MSRESCSWCGGPGPFAQIAWHAAHVPSCYCARCETVRAATGAFPPRTPATKERLLEVFARQRKAREGA